MTTEGERLAAVEQRIADMQREFDAHVGDATRRHNRLRELEKAIILLVEAQRVARADEKKQYRRVEVRLQTLTVAVAFAALLLSLMIWLVHH